MNSKPTIIFDFDGTIANTIPLALEIYNELAPKMHSLPVSEDEFPRLRKLSYKKIIKEKKLNWLRLPWLLRIVPKKMLENVHSIKAYPGVKEVIGRLLAEGYQVGVLSSNNAVLLNKFFMINEFAEFSFVDTERSIFGKDKALKKLFKKFHLNHKDVVYVGDEPRDVVACRKAEVRVIGVTWGLGGHDGFASAKPDVFVDTAEELEKQIRDIS